MRWFFFFTHFHLLSSLTVIYISICQCIYTQSHGYPLLPEVTISSLPPSSSSIYQRLCTLGPLTLQLDSELKTFDKNVWSSHPLRFSTTATNLPGDSIFALLNAGCVQVIVSPAQLTAETSALLKSNAGNIRPRLAALLPAPASTLTSEQRAELQDALSWAQEIVFDYAAAEPGAAEVEQLVAAVSELADPALKPSVSVRTNSLPSSADVVVALDALRVGWQFNTLATETEINNLSAGLLAQVLVAIARTDRADGLYTTVVTDPQGRALG